MGSISTRSILRKTFDPFGVDRKGEIWGDTFRGFHPRLMTLFPFGEHAFGLGDIVRGFHPRLIILFPFGEQPTANAIGHLRGTAHGE